MKKIQRLIFLFLCCMLLSSCSGMKNIQDLTYIVTIGIDYDDETEEFTVYLQALNFANVAKQESGKPAGPIPTFVSSAKGETLNIAISKLYKKSEPPIFFGHVKTIIFSQRLVEHKFKDVIEELGRSRTLRETTRIVTTEEDIKKVLSIKALFDYPAIYTVISKKSGTETTQDEIRPTTLMNFLRDYYEPIGVAKIPTVKIDEDSWKTNENYPILYFNGYSIFQNRAYKNVLPFDEALYVNWVSEKRVALDVKVQENDKLLAVVGLESPKMKVKYEKGAATPKFTLEITIRSEILEKIEDISLKQLENLIKKDISSKIEGIYKKGLENKIDLFNVGEKWFKFRPKEYAKLKRSNKFYLNEASLQDIKVQVEVINFNSYKYEREGKGDF
ncbi:Ger(x)C family spore germination protein [Ectobacillus antri]|uniref:Ger(x)C family spore germination protein n=1 Tax=Ectobacillus antri TaxID=2486280 RepID=UPI000F58FC4A|nr:Ger(x)C family spore germination protein [Ectobacillus antri]